MLIFTGSSHSINLETLANASSPSSFLPVFWSWRALKAHASSCPLQSSSLSKVLELHSSIPALAKWCTCMHTHTHSKNWNIRLLQRSTKATFLSTGGPKKLRPCNHSMRSANNTSDCQPLGLGIGLSEYSRRRGCPTKRWDDEIASAQLHTKFLAYLQSVSPKKAKERIDRQYRYLHQTTSIRPICWHTLMQEDLPGYTWSISTKASGQGSPSVSSQLGFHSSSWLFWAASTHP